MNRLELNKKIIDIYASTLSEFQKNEFSKSINSNLTTVFLMQKNIEKKLKIYYLKLKMIILKILIILSII